MSNSSSKVLLAGITGLAAGIAIGLLFAPSKGSKTRKKLKKRLMNLAEIVEDQMADRFGPPESIFDDEDEDEEEEEEEDTTGEKAVTTEI